MLHPYKKLGYLTNSCLTNKLCTSERQILINIHELSIAVGIGLFLTIASISTNISSASAHKIKTDAQVGATLHIEPNDNPRAGESAKTWFALTRKGGKLIPLSECDCKLQVYKEPVKPQSSPILQPSLRPVSAERYQEIPGSEIIFPQPGAYQLKLSGSATATGSFQAFELEFPVTVAAGESVSNNTDDSEITTKDVKTAQGIETQGGGVKAFVFPIWAIGLSAIAVLGVLLFVFQGRKNG